MKPHRKLPPVCRKGPKAQKVFQRHFKGQEETSDTCGLQWVRNAELGPGDYQGLGEGKGKAAEAITHAVSYTIKQPAWKWVCLIFLLSFLSICTWGVCVHARVLLYVNTWRDTQTCGDVCGSSGLKLGVFFNHLSTLFIEVQFCEPGTHLSSQSS